MWRNSQYSNLVYTSLGMSTTFVQFMVKKMALHLHFLFYLAAIRCA